MYRIYFDKNIFSNLKKQKDKMIEENLLSDDRLFFLYSPAHLDDLKQDKTDIKYEELTYIGKFTNHFLYFDIQNQNVSMSKILPLVKFKNVEAIGSNSRSQVDIDFNSDMISALKELPFFGQYSVILDSAIALNEMITNIPEKYVISNLPTNPSADMVDYINKLGIENREYEQSDWVKLTNSIADKFYDDEKLYGLARRLGMEENQIKKLQINMDDIDFDDKFKLTQIGRSFYEVVEESFSSISKIPLADNFYIQYTLTYLYLNVFGIDGEKNSKVRFANMIQDAVHSFYAIHCDYLISEDKGLQKKSKFLYNLFGFHTKVMGWDEFLEEYQNLGVNFANIGDFINQLKQDVEVIPLENSYITEGDLEDKIMHRYLSKKYFSYFNMMEVHQIDDIQYSYFLNNRGIRFDYVAFAEIEYVVNNVCRLFGTDVMGHAEFNEKDIELLKIEKWYGRKWKLDRKLLSLDLNLDSNKLLLLLGSVINETEEEEEE